MSDNAVIERNIRGSLLQFANLERGSCPIGDVEAFALARRREEYLVVGLAADGLGKARLEVDGDDAGVERARTEVFNPVLGRLHAVRSEPLRSARLDGRAQRTGAEQVAGDINRALSAEGRPYDIESQIARASRIIVGEGQRRMVGIDAGIRGDNRVAGA